MKRRLFSLFLALTLVVGMLPAPAFAQETESTQATQAPTEASTPTEAPRAEPTQAPTEAPTEAPAAEPTQPVAEAQPTEPPAQVFAEPAQDEAVAAVQAMIDALPDVEDMSESYLDALEAAYSAFDALSETQQAQITGVEKLEALFNWVNSQVSTLAAEKTISGEVTWNNRTFTTPVKLTGDTTLTLVGDNKIECGAPLDLNDYNLTVKGTGSLTVIGNGRSEKWMFNGAIFDSAYKGTTYGGGTLYIEGGTVTASGGKYNAISVFAVDLKGGKLEANGSSNAGIVCSYLYTYGGSLYATGDVYGIEMRTRYASNPGNLTILASDERDAQKAEMDEGKLGDINNNAKKKTYYIGEVTGPMLSVKAQKGYLYEGTADQTATFSYSAKNLDGCIFGVEWTGAHLGLTADFSENGDQTIIVTTKDTVKRGTYELKLIVRDAENVNTLATKTVTVTVLGAPITVTAQPQDASARCKKGELDAWQGDKEIQVTAKLAAGLTGDITYQWKLEDGTELEGFNQPTLSLKNLYSGNQLPPVAGKSWLCSAKVYCTLTYGSHSVKTNAVTLTVNTCVHENAKPDGTCQQCGEPCSSEPLLVREDGAYYAVDTSGIGDAEVGGGILTGGGTVYLTKDVLSRDMNAGNYTAGSENVILDLQDHTLNRLKMGNFPYGSFTLKNGTLGEIDTVASGKLILENIRYQGKKFDNEFELTVQGGNTLFERPVTFWGTTHLKGGRFSQGLDSNCVDRALELLDAGFAFRDDQGIVDASIPENLSGEIQVVAHKCNYVNGKCECGRTCDHVDKVDDNGYCTFCHALVVPYAIGEDRYTSLEAALAAAKEGDTITLRGDFYQGSKTVEINKSVTLNLGGHTLTSDADGEPVLLILAENVTIQNGTVQNTRTAKSSPAVTVGETGAAAKAGLTVKDVTFIGSSDGNAPQQYALNIYNGHAKVESGIFNGGIFAQGDLTMTGGSGTKLKLGYVMGKVELSGGSFDSIRFNADADYLGLLADGYAYRSGGKFVKPADMNDSTKVEIVKCTHPDGLTADTACPYCGKKCGHENIDQTTGLCPECGYQKAASLTVNGTTTFFNTFRDAVSKANGQTGARLTLLKDEVMQGTSSLTFGGGKITIDWKGHTLSGQPDLPNSVIALYGAAELTLCDSSGNNAGGIAAQNAEAISVLGGSLTIESGTYGCRVCIPGDTATVKISGGVFKNDGSASYDYAIDTDGSRYLAALMAPGYTLALDSKGTNLYDVYANKATPEHTNVYVVRHTSHNFDESGKCACGAAAPVQVEAGTGSSYFSDFESAVNQAKSLSGSTVRLRDNVTHSGDSGVYIDSGTFTIDWNGHTISGSSWNDLLVITDSANVTLKDSSGTNAGGVCNTGYGAAVCIAVRSGSVNIQGGTYSPNVTRSERCYGSVQISGGVFENPEDHGRNCALYNASGSPLSGMLAPDTAFAYKADGSDLLKAYYVHQSESYRTVYAVVHTHKNWTDGVCDCGYTCPHEHWTDGVCDLCGGVCAHAHYENGKCTTCGYPCPHEDVTEKGGVYICDICHLTMTVMVETADGNVSYTTDLAAALNNAENGTTVKLLGDVSLENSAYIEDGKEVTLNLNGHNITRTRWQIIQVDANTDDRSRAKLVITGSGEIRFNVKAADGGQLDMSDWTGTAACVDLENACDFVGPIGDGHLGELNISNWRSDNKGTILLQGGTIGKLWLNGFDNSFQMALGSLLKSGYAAKSGSEFLPYDHAISNQDKIHNLTIEPCPHTGLDSSGRCTYCNTTGFVATVTKNGVTTGYTDFQSALGEIRDGKRGTLKLLTDVSGQYVYRISGTLDLNGKNLAGKLVCAQGSDLQIVNSGSSDMSEMKKLEVWNGAKVTIADTAGSILFDMVTVESGSLAKLLPEGGAYFRTDMRTWISAAEAATKQTLGSVVVREAPVKSVTLDANKTSVLYGESQTVTLTASSTQSEGVTASYAWAEVTSDGTVQTFPEEAGTSFTLPAGVNAGEHTYRVSVTVGDYTLSKDIQITVTKAPGTLVNKDYPTEFTYGDTIPTPKAENFTTNHPDGTFSYHWKTGNNSGLEPGANPVDAGTYMLCATWTGGTNYTTASLSLAVTIQKADQTADITVVNETISGKGDGGVTLKPSADVYEIRKKGETTFEAISASQGETFHTLIPGVYEIRLAGTKNYLSTVPQEVTVQPGRKLKVTLPTNQEGYTLTASKTQLDWHENVELSFQLDSVGAYKAADFGIWAEAGSEKTKLTLGNDGAVKLTAPEKDITITVTGVKTDDREPKASIRGRQLTENSLAYVKWEGFQENPADDFVNGDFVISATDRGSGVASLWYCLSQTPLTLAEMDTASWVSAPLTGTNQAKVPITENGVYYLYVKALDKANNAGYACTGKLVKESNPPTFSGVKDGETYYVSQQMEIHDDGMPDWYMAKGSIGVVPNGGNENPIKLKLKNDGSPCTITAGDRCGNEASITVYMKPLSDLTQPLYSILEDTIRKSDRATLDDVEATLKGLDVTYAFDSEKKEMNDALARIAQLRQVLDQVAAVEAQIDALPDSVEPYQQTVEDTQIKPARQAYSDLTDHQKTLVDSAKLDKLVRLEAQLDAWTITEGDGQTWYKGSGKSLSFTVNGQRRKFDGIRQGNTYIGSGVSSVLTASGEMDKPFTLTLKPEFLQCQTPGEHSFTMVYYSGLYSSEYLSISVTYTVETPANYLDVTDREEFNGKTTVTVDGKEYPIEEMAGYLQRIPTQRYVNLPETGDLLTIYSFKDGTPEGSYTNYPTGMQVFRITRQEGGAKAEEIPEFANLLNYAGCSIRVSGKKGIRMITGIDQNVKKSLLSKAGLAGYTLEEYGTVVQWADTLGSNTLNLSSSNKQNYAYKKGKADPIFALENGMIQYTNVLVGFTDAQCQPDLVMRPYIKLIDTATGETVTLYGGSVTRSIGYVAWQNRDTYKQGTASYKYVWNIINSVDTSKYPN